MEMVGFPKDSHIWHAGRDQISNMYDEITDDTPLRVLRTITFAFKNAGHSGNILNVQYANHAKHYLIYRSINT